MSDIENIAPAFVDMAHRIVWASVATVDPENRPRTRILHPIWQWDGSTLVGWIATGPTAVKRSHLHHSPYLSVSYWAPNHDTCSAECSAEWFLDDDSRDMVWNLFKDAPPPVGYDPAIIPPWADGPQSPAFGALRLEPRRLRVFPGTALLGQGGAVLSWSAGAG